METRNHVCSVQSITATWSVNSDGSVHTGYIPTLYGLAVATIYTNDKWLTIKFVWDGYFYERVFSNCNFSRRYCVTLARQFAAEVKAN